MLLWDSIYPLTHFVLATLVFCFLNKSSTFPPPGVCMDWSSSQNALSQTLIGFNPLLKTLLRCHIFRETSLDNFMGLQFYFPAPLGAPPLSLLVIPFPHNTFHLSTIVQLTYACFLLSISPTRIQALSVQGFFSSSFWSVCLLTYHQPWVSSCLLTLWPKE